MECNSVTSEPKSDEITVQEVADYLRNLGGQGWTTRDLFEACQLADFGRNGVISRATFDAARALNRGTEGKGMRASETSHAAQWIVVIRGRPNRVYGGGPSFGLADKVTQSVFRGFSGRLDLAEAQVARRTKRLRKDVEVVVADAWECRPGDPDPYDQYWVGTTDVGA